MDTEYKQNTELDKAISRREFLRLAGLAAIGCLVTACRGATPITDTGKPSATAAANTATPSATSMPPTVTPSATQAIRTPTPSVRPTTLITPTATATATIPTGPRVAIAQAASYDPKLIRQRLRELLDGLGGLGDVVHRGDRVAIKVNLTGGTKVAPLPGVSAIESYVTHPEVVHALVEMVRDAGAKEVFIVEAVYEWDSYKLWGYEKVAEATGAQLIDLNQTRPYNDFAKTPVGEGSLIYPYFTFNHILEDVDVFMSVAKMKNHWHCGVTHAMKNLIGLVPARFYTMAPTDSYRSAFHGPERETKARLPRVIIDLNRARPIHFALIDGIKTAQGGEGPWIKTMTPVAPGVLIAGKNAVAADAVATAVMGFDPTADYPKMPFIRCDNHLNIAHQLGLGTNRLEEIQIVGPSIQDVRYPFDTGWS